MAEKEETEEKEKKFTTKGVFNCLSAVEGALKSIEDSCKDVADVDTLKATFGLSEDEINDVSAYCEAMLKPEWLTKERCYDFRDIRRYVMCLTWEKMEKKHLAFRGAIKEAWTDAKTKCRELGAVI